MYDKVKLLTNSLNKKKNLILKINFGKVTFRCPFQIKPSNSINVPNFNVDSLNLRDSPVRIYFSKTKPLRGNVYRVNDRYVNDIYVKELRIT